MCALRLAFISDLHLDHNPGLLPLLLQRLRELEPHLFVIAGDLFNGFSRLGAAISRLRQVVEYVLFLPGNHDLWLHSGTATLTSTELYNSVLKGTVHRAGGHYLGLSPFYMGEVAVCGVTGWYEGYPTPPTTTPDEELCRFAGCPTPAAVVEWQAELLRDQLKRASAHAQRIFVVTHTVPFVHLIREEVEPHLQEYMGSDSLGRVIADFPKVSYVVSGHLHRRCRFALPPRGIPFEISPFGYPGDFGEEPSETLKRSLRLIPF